MVDELVPDCAAADREVVEDCAVLGDVDCELCDDCEEEAGAWLRWLDPSERNIEQPLSASAAAETVTRIARFMGYSNDG